MQQPSMQEFGVRGRPESVIAMLLESGYIREEPGSILVDGGHVGHYLRQAFMFDREVFYNGETLVRYDRDGDSLQDVDVTPFLYPDDGLEYTLFRSQESIFDNLMEEINLVAMTYGLEYRNDTDLQADTLNLKSVNNAPYALMMNDRYIRFAAEPGTTVPPLHRQLEAVEIFHQYAPKTGE